MNDRLPIAPLEDLALEFRRLADTEPQRGWRDRLRTRRALLLTVLALSLGGTATAATIALTTGPPIPPAPAGDFTADQRPLPGSARLAGVQTADPAGGPPWGLMLSRSETGKRCLALGRVLGGPLGVIDRGVFRALPTRGPQSCSDLSAERPIYSRTNIVPNGGDTRTVFSGIASHRITRIDVDDGTRRIRLTPDRDGAYLAVWAGEPTLTWTLHFTDGSSRTLTPPP